MDGAPRPAGGVLKRWLRRGLVALAVAVGALALAVLAGVLWLRGEAGNRYLLSRLLPLVQPDRGAIEVESLSTDLFGRLELRGVRLVDETGAELLAVELATADYTLGGLVGRVLVVDRVELLGVRAPLWSPEGCRDPAELWDPGPPSDAPWTGLGFDLHLHALHLEAAAPSPCIGGAGIALGPTTLDGALSIVGPEVRWTGVSLASTALEPAWGELRLTDAGSWNGERLELEAATLAVGPNRLVLAGRLDDLGGEGRLALRIEEAALEPPSLGVPAVLGPITVRGELDGSLSEPRARLDLSTPGGPLRVEAGARFGEAPPRWNGTVTTPRLDVGAVVPAAGVAVAGGTARVEGQGDAWPEGLLATLEVDLAVEALADLGSGTAKGRAVLEDGVVTLGGVEVRTEGARATVGGTVDLVNLRHDLELTEARVRLSRLEAFGAPALGGTATFSGRVSGGWEGLAGTRVDGRVGADALVWPEVATVDHLDAAVTLGFDEAGRPRGSVTADLAGLEVAGFTADAAALTLHPEGDRVELALSVVEDERELIGARGVYRLDDGSLVLDPVHVSPAPGADWIADRPARLRVDERGVHDVDLALTSAHATLTLAGSWVDEVFDLRLAIDRLDLAGLETVPIAGLSGWTGRATAQATLRGTMAEPDVDLHVEARGVDVPTLLHDADLTVDARTEGPGLRVGARLDGGGKALLRLEGTVPLAPRDGVAAVDPDGPLALTLVLPPRTLGEWAATLEEVPDRDVALSAELRLDGTPADPGASVVASVRARVGDPAEWIVADLDAQARGGRARVRTVVRERLSRRGELSGSLGLDLARVGRALFADGPPVDWDHPEALLSDLSADLVPLQLPLQFLSPFVDLPADLAGSLVGGLHLSGHPLAPRVDGALMLLDGRVGELGVSPAMLTLAGRPEGYDVGLELGFGAEGGLTVTGFVPLSATAFADPAGALAAPGLDLRVGGAGVPVAAVAPFFADTADAEGRVRVQGTVTGSLADPRPDVRLTAEGAALSHLGLNVRAERVRLEARLTADRLQVDALQVHTRSLSRPDSAVSELVGSGTLERAADGPPRVDARLKLDQAWLVDRPDRVARLGGDLRARGTLEHLVVEGGLRVAEGRIVVPERYFLESASLELDPDIVVVRQAEAAPRTGTSADEGWPWLDARLRVDLDRNLDLAATLPTEDLGGALTASLSELRLDATLDDDDGVAVTYDGGAITVVGSVEPVRGGAVVLGKNFRLDGGSVSFTGRDYADPFLDVAATHPNPTYGDIQASITGLASEPRIALTNPLYPSPDDAIAILLFGAPVSEMGGAGAVEGATLLALALQAFASEQVQEAGDLTRLDVFELSSEGVRGGKRLGDGVMMIVGANFGNPDEVNLVELTLEVQLPRRWYFEVTTGTSTITDLAAVRRWRF